MNRTTVGVERHGRYRLWRSDGSGRQTPCQQQRRDQPGADRQARLMARLALPRRTARHRQRCGGRLGPSSALIQRPLPRTPESDDAISVSQLTIWTGLPSGSTHMGTARQVTEALNTPVPLSVTSPSACTSPLTPSRHLYLTPCARTESFRVPLSASF